MDFPMFCRLVLLLLRFFSADREGVVFAFQNPPHFASRRSTAPRIHHRSRSTNTGERPLAVSSPRENTDGGSNNSNGNDDDDEPNELISNARESDNNTNHHRELQILPPHSETNTNSKTNTNTNTNENDDNDNDDELFLLEYSIDSFLRGDYDRTFAEDAASPLPGLSPCDTVDAALRSLRDLDTPEPSHGAAVFLRFCVALGRGERWGTTDPSNANNRNTATNSNNRSSWKELLRGALTPTMLARRLRASEDFSGLLDWSNLVIRTGNGEGEGYAGNQRGGGGSSNTNYTDTVLWNGNVACVDAALYFGDDEPVPNDDDDEATSSSTSSSSSSTPSPPPELYRFEMAKMLGGVWLIDSVQHSSSSVFQKQRQQPPGRSKSMPPRTEGRPPPPPRPQPQREKPRKHDQPKLGDEDNDKSDKRKTK